MLNSKSLDTPSIKQQFSYVHQLHTGMGGSGKSDINLTDKSNVNVLYLAPSWKLTMNKQREYKEIENDKNI